MNDLSFSSLLLLNLHRLRHGLETSFDIRPKVFFEGITFLLDFLVGLLELEHCSLDFLDLLDWLRRKERER